MTETKHTPETFRAALDELNRQIDLLILAHAEVLAERDRLRAALTEVLQLFDFPGGCAAHPEVAEILDDAHAILGEQARAALKGE